MNPQEWLAVALTGGAPEPTTTRWQPLRVGIVNLWEYDDAEFWFADGRLVLRGGNGTGKTKILELTTLMLLRGEISPAVLDPFGSQHRTMKFNLLPTGEEDDPRPPSDQGLGYAWAEFGRLDGNGDSHYLVCGLGASARRGSGTESARRWMFQTTRRPGLDLVLAPPAGPLEEKDLRREPQVEVYDNGGRYRADLAHRLFGLDPAGYDNLTELLKQLRRPKLGERLNPKELESTLRDALPRLATNEVGQLVEGWDRLEELRLSVEQLEGAATAVAAFARRAWLPWVKVVMRQRSDALIAATTRLDKTTRERRAAESSLGDARDQVTTTKKKLEETRKSLYERDAELRALVDSSSYQDAVAATERAASLRREATTQLRNAEQDKGRAEAAAKQLERLAVELMKTRDSTEDAERTVAERITAARGVAESAGLNVAPLLDGADGPDLAGLHSAHASRSERLSHLTTLSRAWEAAEKAVETTSAVVRDREKAIRTRRDTVTGAVKQVEQRTATLRTAVDAWAGTLISAPATPAVQARWHDLIDELTENDSDPVALSAALRAHFQAAESALREQVTELRARRGPVADRVEQTEQQLTRVRETIEQEPPTPVLWGRRDRTEAAGAPLWACVQPRTEEEPGLATLEAALAAAGLLDAWLTPDGVLHGEADTFVLVADPPGRGSRAESLLAVLDPTPAGGVTAERIAAVLSRIGWLSRPDAAGGDVWVAADGSWRTGLLSGRAEAVQPGSYLGATARERARQRRIAELEAELAELRATLETLDDQIGELAERLTALSRERSSMPTAAERDLVRAVADLGAARSLLASTERELEGARSAQRIAIEERDRKRAAAATYAAEHGFPLDDLDSVVRALDEFRHVLGRLESAMSLRAVRREALEQATDNHQDALDRHQAAVDEARHAEETARRAEIAANTAERMLRTDQREQLDRRNELDHTIDSLKRQETALAESLSDLRVQEKAAENTLEGHERARAAAEGDRDGAGAAWWAAVERGLLEPLGIQTPEGRTVKATLEGAQAVRRIIDVTADDNARDRAWRRCFEELSRLRAELLPNRDAAAMDDEISPLPAVVILTEPMAGWQRPDLADTTLAEQVRQQRNKFDAEQQRVLSRLLGSAFIEHLKERLDYTDSVFTRINGVLGKHPTRQGHTLQLVWQPDSSDPDAGQVVEALRQGYEHLAEARQDMVRGFLRRRIEQAREEATAQGVADWQEHLAAALDYRRWLRVQLQFRPGSSSRWRLFDAARHGSKSGGEKVVLLSQPLFAAAVVAYDAAGPDAPRMVWLDEAMTGVDVEVKATFMGLTVELDLDVMLTAHDEWCNYATVPAAAIYDLARQRYVPGVDAMPYLWCGGDLIQTETTLAMRARSADHLAEEGTLFA